MATHQEDSNTNEAPSEDHAIVSMQSPIPSSEPEPGSDSAMSGLSEDEDENTGETSSEDHPIVSMQSPNPTDEPELGNDSTMSDLLEYEDEDEGTNETASEDHPIVSMQALGESRKIQAKSDGLSRLHKRRPGPRSGPEGGSYRSRGIQRAPYPNGEADPGSDSAMSGLSEYEDEDEDTHGTASEDHPTVSMQAPYPNGEADPGNDSASSTKNIIPTSSGLGLLSLPPEVRLLVYRQLLVLDHPLSTNWPGMVWGLRPYSPHWPRLMLDLNPPILKTSSLIRREAFQVMYGENTFLISPSYSRTHALYTPPVRDVLRKVQVDVNSNDRWPYLARGSFIPVIRAFDSPAIIRGTLDIILRVNHPVNELLDWLAVALCRFTNFETVKIAFADSGYAASICVALREEHMDTFTSYLGPARPFDTEYGLTFHPRQFQDSLPLKVEVDWQEHLDGIRLKWNEDPSRSLS
ncbi:hypothetical protein MMC22_011529 [Lobaria immixta]|nr:hypothetical protein [Lobaria immixta]